MVLKEQENLRQLNMKIEMIRNQLHTAYQNKRTFSDPDVYRLSLYLDDLIVEYQSCFRFVLYQHGIIEVKQTNRT